MNLLLTSDNLGGTLVRTSETGPLLAYVSHPKGSRRWHIYLADRTGGSPTRTTKRLIDVLPALEELLADEIAAAAPADEVDAWPGEELAEATVAIVYENGVVEIVDDEASVPGRATCGDCGRSWDDSVSTGLTPVPAGRCPFEVEHDDVDEVDETFVPAGPFRHHTGATGRASTAFAPAGSVNVVWDGGTFGQFTLAEFLAECEMIEEEEPEPVGPSVTVGNVLVVRSTTGSGTVSNPFDADQCEHLAGFERQDALRRFRAGLPTDGLGFWRHMPSARPVERSEVRWNTAASDGIAPMTEAERLRRAGCRRLLDADERRAVELADKLPPVGRRVVVDVVTLGTEFVEGTVVEHVDLPAGSSRVLRAVTVPAAVLVTDEGRAVTFPAGVVRSWSEVEAVSAGR